ncbi:MAG TPA: PQQ-binding-like beta-propeller repeat protein [Solirubrobacterales bacterium]|jgi:outer membrane protein assembly factor BamB
MDGLRGVSRAACAVTAIAVLALVALLSGCGSSSSDSGPDFTGSGYPNGDTSNTRQTSGPINSSSVTGLEQAWELPITATSAFGSYASSPIISKGVMYSQDLASNVQAIDVETGEVLWSTPFEQADHGPNGVVVANGLVFGATPIEAFALDQKTGNEVWSVELARNEKEGIDMAPGYQDGLVYVSTVPVNVEEFYGGNGVGILWALDAKTGKKVWKFNTVPNDLWSSKNANINSGGGLWYTPAFDEKGSMYISVGNPGPIPGTEKYPWGSSRPGPNLYTDSLVKLDAKTGKMDWYYQATPHDVNDWDLQDPPILATAGGKEMVIGAGKSGIVVAVDANSGKLLWKRPVGLHNGHDDIGLAAMNGEDSKLKYPITILPGSLGGVIAPMSTDGKYVFVPVVNSSLTLSSQTEKSEGGPGNGELVALDLATGKIRWKQKLSSPAFGSTTSVNDIVFTTTYDGNVSAFRGSNGAIVWREKLPAGTNSGVTVSGDTLIAPAGVASVEGQKAQIVAYRLNE